MFLGFTARRCFLTQIRPNLLQSFENTNLSTLRNSFEPNKKCNLHTFNWKRNVTAHIALLVFFGIPQLKWNLKKQRTRCDGRTSTRCVADSSQSKNSQSLISVVQLFCYFLQNVLLKIC